MSKTIAGVPGHNRKRSNNKGSVAESTKRRTMSDDLDDKKDKKCVVF
jgi:hypothetical protein